MFDKRRQYGTHPQGRNCAIAPESITIPFPLRRGILISIIAHATRIQLQQSRQLHPLRCLSGRRTRPPPRVPVCFRHRNILGRSLISFSLTNWVPKTPGFLDLCGQWETYLQKYQSLAKECNICIVPGTIVERHRDAKTEEDRLLNVAYFIDNTGSVLSKYVKKNLWHPERPHLSSSTDEPHIAFDTPVGRCGMLICWDLAFPEAFRELICDGAKIIVIPCFWGMNDCSEEGLKINPLAEGLFLDSMLTARCFENTCAIIFANAGAPTSRGYAGGLSQVCVPFIGPITRLGSSGEGMSVVDLDLGILDVAEENYKVREDLARYDWHYDYRHDKRKEREKL